jgi:FixJ family two-component response regulator
MTSQRPSKSATTGTEPFVVVVDDDQSVRDALDSLFRSVGLATRLFGTADALLNDKLPDAPGCLVLDVRLPGISGLDFQERLCAQGFNLPTIFMTGHGDIPMTVRAMKAGATDFLQKPFRDQDILDAVNNALNRSRQIRAQSASLDEVRRQYSSLTPREAEVMSYVVKGLMNKQIAGEMGLSEITVKIHRGNVMRKMGVRSVADLVRKAEDMGLGRDRG